MILFNIGLVGFWFDTKPVLLKQLIKGVSGAESVSF